MAILQHLFDYEDPTLSLLHAFGTDIGDTQAVSNVTNSYLEQICIYLDAFLCILYGKHPKTNWYQYTAYQLKRKSAKLINLCLGLVQRCHRLPLDNLFRAGCVLNNSD